MTAYEFVRERPRLFHFTAAGAWTNLQRHGLFTTDCLLKRASLDSEEDRRRIAQERRRGNITLDVRGVGPVIVRDQRPLHNAGLVKALPDGFDPQRWIDLLNERVFFWTTRHDCMKLVDAKLNRGSGTLLELDASSLLATYEADVELTTFNVGYTLRRPKARSAESFVPFASYPSTHLKKMRELTVKRSIIDVTKYVLAVTEWNEAGGGTYTQVRVPKDVTGLQFV